MARHTRLASVIIRTRQTSLHRLTSITGTARQTRLTRLTRLARLGRLDSMTILLGFLDLKVWLGGLIFLCRLGWLDLIE